MSVHPGRIANVSFAAQLSLAHLHWDAVSRAEIYSLRYCGIQWRVLKRGDVEGWHYRSINNNYELSYCWDVEVKRHQWQIHCILKWQLWRETLNKSIFIYCTSRAKLWQIRVCPLVLWKSTWKDAELPSASIFCFSLTLPMYLSNTNML